MPMAAQKSSAQLQGEDTFVARTAAAPAIPSPPQVRFRPLRAYLVTLQIVLSYLWLRVEKRFCDAETFKRRSLVAHTKNAKRAERAIRRLQGLFIKLGQLISVMSNFLPHEFRKELEGLQDQLAPRPFFAMEKSLIAEFGQKPQELFSSFDPHALAAASIGQVHTAIWNGQRLAVKIQYPDIEALVKADLRLLRNIIWMVGLFFSNRSLRDLYEEIEVMVHAEIDFSREAQNITEISIPFREHPRVVFPTVVPEFSTKRVLTTRFEAGVKITDFTTLEAQGICRVEVAKVLIELYCQQIFIDGCYHADPHPGNILIRPNPTHGFELVLLDFGEVARVTEPMRRGIVDLLRGAMLKDTPGVIRSLKQMGFVSKTAEPQVYERVVEYLHEQFHQQISLDTFNLKDIQFDPNKAFEQLADLRRMDVSLEVLSEHFYLPKEWLVLERTFLLLLGLCTTLAPSLKPMTIIRPYLETFVLGDKRDWSTLFLSASKDVAMAASALPGELQRFLTQVRRGELQVKSAGQKATRSLLVRSAQALVCVFGTIAAIAFAIQFEDRYQWHRATIAWWAGGACSLGVLWSFWRMRKHL